MFPYTCCLAATVILSLEAEIHKTPFDYSDCKHATELKDLLFLSMKHRTKLLTVM